MECRRVLIYLCTLIRCWCTDPPWARLFLLFTTRLLTSLPAPECFLFSIFILAQWALKHGYKQNVFTLTCSKLLMQILPRYLDSNMFCAADPLIRGSLHPQPSPVISGIQSAAGWCMFYVPFLTEHKCLRVIKLQFASMSVWTHITQPMWWRLWGKYLR